MHGFAENNQGEQKRLEVGRRWRYPHAADPQERQLAPPKVGTSAPGQARPRGPHPQRNSTIFCARAADLATLVAIGFNEAIVGEILAVSQSSRRMQESRDDPSEEKRHHC